VDVPALLENLPGLLHQLLGSFLHRTGHCEISSRKNETLGPHRDRTPSESNQASKRVGSRAGGGSGEKRTSGPSSSAPQALEGDAAAAAGPRVQRRRDVAEAAALRGSPAASTEAMRGGRAAWISAAAAAAAGRQIVAVGVVRCGVGWGIGDSTPGRIQKWKRGAGLESGRGRWRGGIGRLGGESTSIGMPADFFPLG
jgi:hypothetical protein